MPVWCRPEYDSLFKPVPRHVMDNFRNRTFSCFKTPLGPPPKVCTMASDLSVAASDEASLLWLLQQGC